MKALHSRLNSVDSPQLETSIVRQAQRLEPDAISWLYQHYFQQVYRYIAVRVRRQSDVEDLTAQVFVTMIEKLHSYRGEGSFAAWIFRVAHNQVIDHLRSQNYNGYHTTGMDEIMEEQIEDAGQNPEDIFQNKALQAELNSAMHELTELQRQVVALRFVAHLSSSEIAGIMGRKENAIYALQHSALAALKRILQRRGIEPAGK